MASKSRTVSNWLPSTRMGVAAGHGAPTRPWQQPDTAILVRVLETLLAQEDGPRNVRRASLACRSWHARAMEVVLADTAVSRPAKGCLAEPLGHASKGGRREHAPSPAANAPSSWCGECRSGRAYGPVPAEAPGVASVEPSTPSVQAMGSCPSALKRASAFDLLLDAHVDSKSDAGTSAAARCGAKRARTLPATPSAALSPQPSEVPFNARQAQAWLAWRVQALCLDGRRPCSETAATSPQAGARERQAAARAPQRVAGSAPAPAAAVEPLGTAFGPPGPAGAWRLVLPGMLGTVGQLFGRVAGRTRG